MKDTNTWLICDKTGTFSILTKAMAKPSTNPTVVVQKPIPYIEKVMKHYSKPLMALSKSWLMKELWKNYPSNI